MGGCTVWVIGQDVEGQLAPYENAIERGYPYASSLSMDVLDYMKEVFLGGINCACTVDAAGKIYPPWDEVFQPYKPWVHSPTPLPEGRRLKNLAAKDIMSFAE